MAALHAIGFARRVIVRCILILEEVVDEAVPFQAIDWGSDDSMEQSSSCRWLSGRIQSISCDELLLHTNCGPEHRMTLTVNVRNR